MGIGHIYNEYFIWVCDQVIPNNPDYTRLLDKLNGIEFVTTHPMDDSRLADGLNLRFEFGYAKGYSRDAIRAAFDQYPCSVFEMMAALAIRCENQIMENDKFGDRTPFWFAHMIQSLGLEGQTNFSYDELYVDEVIFDFLNRNYDETGAGSLFYVPNPSKDMRSLDLWYQMHEFLRTIPE